MCPACMTTVAAIVAGTGAAASLTTLVLGKRRPEHNAPAPAPSAQPEEKRS
jgi:hypothetical protein